jgi:TonB family protein
MKIRFLTLASAALWLAASTSFAVASELQPIPPGAQAEAARRLSAAGVDANTVRVSVQAGIDADGGVTKVSVLRSSGSRQTDRAVEAVLRQVVRAHPPIGLEDGTVTLNVGAAQLSAR